MFNSPASKMGKSNSSMYATKFSLKSERSIDPLWTGKFIIFNINIIHIQIQ